jgi:hypothetical protein
MLPIGTENFGLIYPMKFTSPLSIAECKNRLQQSLGKSMGSLFTPIEGEVEMLDDKTCKFRLYQVVSKSGNRNIVGYLYAQTDSSTLVDAVFGIETTPPAQLTAVIIVMVIVAVMFISFQQILAALVSTLILGSLSYFVWRNKPSNYQLPRPPHQFKKEPASQLLWWFERALKDKNYLPL